MQISRIVARGTAIASLGLAASAFGAGFALEEGSARGNVPPGTTADAEIAVGKVPLWRFVFDD